MKNFRDWLSIIIIAISSIVLGIVGYKIIAQGDTEDYQYVYSSLLPLIGTWVGAVLAFYFGRENYEVASKGYEKIIQKLSPDVLDDVLVSQIMIAKKTMVSQNWEDIKDQTVQKTIEFLIGIDKSRLPVLDEKGSIKYIIHDSLLSKPMKQGGAAMAANTTQNMVSFVKNFEGIIDNIVWVDENDILENTRKKMNETPNCKDVFVKNAQGELVGWLTDTLILRFINSKNI
ncbi:MAG: CBS domain-containing protein [Flavobacteriaceae bacterium]